MFLLFNTCKSGLAYTNVTINMDKVEYYHIGTGSIKMYMESNAIVIIDNDVANIETLARYMLVNKEK